MTQNKETRQKCLEKLAAIIEASPTCNFEIDNDCWYITKPNPEYNGRMDGVEPVIELANSSTFDWESDWYNWSNNYGEGLAEVLVFMLNKRGFNITASAV